MLCLYELPDGSHVRYGGSGGLDLRGMKGWIPPPRYTDGSPGGFLVPASHRMIRHPDTGRMFWLSEARALFVGPGCGPPRRRWLERRLDALLGRAAPVDLGEIWRQAPHALRLRLEHLQQALAEGLADQPSRELSLRLRLWWGWANQTKPDFSARDWINNLRALLPLLPENPEGGTLLKVEVCRQLGDFTAARHWLNWPVATALEKLQAYQRELVARGETSRQECGALLDLPEKRKRLRRRH